MRISYYALAAILLLAFGQSCVDHNFPLTTPCDQGTGVSFQNDVQPIIEAKCAIPGCHNGSTSLPNWNNFATLQDYALTSDLRSLVVNRQMPVAGSPGGSLSQDEIDTIVCWIDNGAQNN
jgi:hypothetical protein